MKDKFLRLSCGEVINLDAIESVSKPINRDPYYEEWGPEYIITLFSGKEYPCLDHASQQSGYMGFSVLKYNDLMKLLGMPEINIEDAEVA
jgi:hypothetical protein